jgi:hypothetical protein
VSHVDHSTLTKTHSISFCGLGPSAPAVVSGDRADLRYLNLPEKERAAPDMCLGRASASELRREKQGPLAGTCADELDGLSGEHGRAVVI